MPERRIDDACSEGLRAEVYVDDKALDGTLLTQLAQELRSGARDRVRFAARVFLAQYPNANYFRFRDEDMDRFAGSFASQPFLRDHDTNRIESRDGTVYASRFEGGAIVQEIDITSQRGLQSFADGQIDRFSIGWFYEALTCTVCGLDWSDYDACRHLRGRRYKDADGREHLCEIIFERPGGKETSAVNVPAVGGTGLLAELQRAKQAHISTREENSKMDPVENVVEEEMAQIETVELPAQAAAEPLQHDWAAYMRQTALASVLQASGLNEPACQAVRASLREGDGPQEVQAAIARMRAALGAERDAAVVRGIQPLTAGDMNDGLDRLKADFDWILGVEGARTPDPRSRNLKDLYTALTGDYQLRGKFDPEQAQLANANSTTFAGVVLDAMNRLVQQYYNNEVTYRWFEQVVEVAPHDGSTHDVNMVMVDGHANLPTVAEGAAYTEGTIGDSKETMSFSKKGNYVGITLEMIRKNSIARMRTIPLGLVQACTRTRSAAIASIFTANSGAGPTLNKDDKALFHTDHGNLATTAFARASWGAMRTRIWKQKLPGTGLPFGIWPRYALVPMDLYDTALTIFGYGAGDVGKPNSAGTAQEPNPYGEARPMDQRPIPVPVPEFTDTNDWAAVVDPSEHAPLKIAYANAPGGNMHPMPELFEAESPNGGLMFTNDTLPIKVRDWFAYGVATHVGLGKSNAS